MKIRHFVWRLTVKKRPYMVKVLGSKQFKSLFVAVKLYTILILLLLCFGNGRLAGSDMDDELLTTWPLTQRSYCIVHA